MVNTLPQARRGFTLMELAIIIAIVGILAAVGALKYASMTAEAKTAGAQAALANARSAFAIAIAKDTDGNVTVGEYTTYLENVSDVATNTFVMDGKYKVTLEMAGTAVKAVTGVVAQ